MPTFGTTRGKVKDRSSSYAEEGTTAHELAELYLAKRFKLLTARAVNSRLKFLNETIRIMTNP